MLVRRCHDLDDFTAHAWPYLLEREAENNLILGLSSDIAAGRYTDPYLAVVLDEGAAVGAALRTPPHPAIVSGPPAVAELLARDLLDADPALTGVTGPSATARAFAEYARDPARRRLAMHQRIYELDAVVPPTGVPGVIRTATPDDADLVRRWFAAFNDEAGGGPRSDFVDHRIDAGAIVLWHDGEPVPVAMVSGPTPNGIRIGGVYTPSGRRGRGYASACVAALSRRELDRGRRFCFLFTDLSNPTSNKIYQQIGYRPVCDVDPWLFIT